MYLVLPRYTLYLLENSEGSLSGLLQGDALMISFLERLLSSLATAPDSLGVELEIGSAGVHVVELRSALITSEGGQTTLERPRDDGKLLTQRTALPLRMVLT